MESTVRSPQKSWQFLFGFLTATVIFGAYGAYAVLRMNRLMDSMAETVRVATADRAACQATVASQQRLIADYKVFVDAIDAKPLSVEGHQQKISPVQLLDLIHPGLGTMLDALQTKSQLQDSTKVAP
jgi:hypothetical protein